MRPLTVAVPKCPVRLSLLIPTLSLLFLAGPSFLSSQQPGVVTGEIVSPTGQPIATAQVALEEISRGTLSQANGRYRIQGVPAGEYTLSVTLIGYRTERTTITVSAGETTTMDFVLDQDPLSLEAIVVTATRTPRTKLESSTAITNIPAVEIEREQPRNTADLLKVVPGFYVESSGGEVGNNLWARGLPADGSYRYVVLMEDGMPVFDATELFFVNADIFVRVDENLERIEGVRGGNSALFGSNAPGGVINFISRTGGPELAGSIVAEGGTDGLGRLSANVNGPLGEDPDLWRFSLGGFYRYDDGVRDPGFTANNGGQLKGNITRFFERGYVRLYGKYMNDRNLFLLPVPLTNPPDPEFVPGFPSDGTMTTDFADDLEIRFGDGTRFAHPLSDGQKQTGGSLMLDLWVDLGSDWTLTNKARYMNIDHEWNGIFPGLPTETADFAAGLIADTPGATGARFTFAGGGAFDLANDLVAPSTIAHVDKPMENISDEIQLKKVFDAGSTRHNFSIGSYVGYYSADNTWIFSDILTAVENGPRLVDLELVDAAGNTVQRVTDGGIRNHLGFLVSAEGNVTHVSLFAGDEIEVNDQLRFDIGVRYEHDEFEQNVEGTQAFDLGGPTSADDAVQATTGAITSVDQDFDEWAVSGGVNYLVNDQVSIYGRASRGYKMPILDNFLFGTDPDDPGFFDEAEELVQAEAGIKVGSPYVGVSAVGYWLELSNTPSQDVQTNVETGETEFIATFGGESRTIGAEIEVVAQPTPELRLKGTATLQDPEWQSLRSGDDVFDGNQVRRVPNVILNLGGFYQSTTGFGLGADWTYIGNRWSNNNNTIELDSFGYLDARAEYAVPDRNLTLSVGLNNAFDGEGLTEGDPRVDEQLGAQRSFFNARPIIPRRVLFSARYRF